jgi:transposase
MTDKLTWKGRKRHIVVDTEGLLLKVFVSEANYYDGTVGTWLMPDLRKRFPRLKNCGRIAPMRGALLIRHEIPTTLRWESRTDCPINRAFKSFRVGGLRSIPLLGLVIIGG